MKGINVEPRIFIETESFKLINELIRFFFNTKDEDINVVSFFGKNNPLSKSPLPRCKVSMNKLYETSFEEIENRLGL